MKKRRMQIGISGSYGGMNLGDEAILESIVRQLRAAFDAEITVFGRNPADTLARHAVDHAVNVRRLTRKESAGEMTGLDLFVLGGGGILYDGDAEMYVRELSIARELGIPAVVYAISAGPLRTSSARRAVQRALDGADLITVRDRIGRRLLEDVGVTREIHLTADPALLLEPEPLAIEALEAEGVDFTRKLVGFSVREPGPAAPDIDPDEYYALLANAADFVIERYDAEAIFVPMELTDVQHSHAVVARMRNAEHAEILRRRYSPRQILDLVGRFDFVVGMRLHFLIFAAIRGVAFSPLPYATKVSGLLEDLGMDMPALGGIGIGQLLAHIDHSWDVRHTMREEIARRVPALQARAARTAELVAEVVASRGERVARTA
jgi:polysaccharide pyruvyl transferase CsaB